MKILAFLSIALLLFGKGVCLSQENEDINTRLIHEIHSRNVRNVKKLLKIGGDPNFNESNSGRTPLWHASSIKNNAKIVKLLIQHGAEIDFQDDYNGFTPLQCAIYDRRFENATLLLDAGANVRLVDKLGRTPILLASQILRFGDPNLVKPPDFRIVKLMLRKKNPINQPDKEGLTPLQCACEDGNFEIAHLLKRAGATLKNENECSFVGSAIRGDVRLMKTSVAKGVNVEYRDRWGMTAFLRAAEVGQEGALKFLISQHIDLHQTNRDKLSAMDYAIKGSHHSIIQALCGANWDVNRLEEDGKSAFHLACEWQKGKIAQLLLQKGADPNRSSKDGNSPLHYAVGEPMSEELDGPVYAGADDISLVILLLKKGAKANVKNQEGETPIDIALRLRKPKMWNALVRSLTE